LRKRQIDLIYINLEKKNKNRRIIDYEVDELNLLNSKYMGTNRVKKGNIGGKLLRKRKIFKV